MEHADELSLKIDMSRTPLIFAGLACAAVVILTHVAELNRRMDMRIVSFWRSLGTTRSQPGQISN